ncbi:MAG: patatin-like protein [Chloroflexi bacterium]|nr:patatin-like protein [Chloroflexota bacterium]
MSTPVGSQREGEVRIGLVLYGGVSLAIYIHGATLEFLRLVQASEGAAVNGYTRLLQEASTRATVDIISGASAGGINGVTLAKALCNGSSLEGLKQLWRQKADLSLLLHRPDTADPKALLNEVYYEARIREALETMDRDRSTRPLAKALDLFLSSTDLHGRVLAVKDFLGNPVQTRQHRKVFHLRFRTRGYNAYDPTLGYPWNDLAPEKNETLVRLCRATSAFPVAFRPVTATRGQDPALFFDPEDPRVVHLSDGGILNNKPFTAAIKSIFTRSADRKVNRVLFFVEPDPETFAPEAESPPEPSFLDVATRALTGIPLYQSIAADLQDVQERNTRIREFQGMAKRVEELLRQVHGPYLAALGMGLPAYGRGSGYRARLQGEVLYQGYQELKLEGVKRTLKARFAGALSDRPAAQRAFAAAVDYAARRDPGGFLQAFDTDFRVRKYYRMIELLEEFSAQPTVAQGAADFSRLESRLWAHLDRARDNEWRAWTTEPEGWFRSELTALRALTGARLRQGVRLLLAQAQARLLQEFDTLRSEARGTVARIDARMQWVVRRLPPGTQLQLPIDAFRALREQFELRDMFLYPMALLSNLGERDPIEIVRISPRDATFIQKPAGDKVAGDALFHFGGFLKESWRANDILWGRLDAAELIARTLLWAHVRERLRSQPRARQEAEVQRLLREVLPPILAEIAREELPPQTTSQPGFNYKHYLENSHRVGSEGVEDVDAGVRVTLAVRALQVLRNMLRTVAADKQAKSSARWAAGALAGVLGWATRTVTPVVEALFARDPLRQKAYTLLLFALWSWGALTLALWGLALIQPNPRIIGLAFGSLLPMSLYAYYRRTWWSILLSLAVPGALGLLAWLGVSALRSRLCDLLCR